MADATDVTPPAPKRSRTGTPRSRGGCFTCRRRRVKCDEGMPHCQRCVKLGVTCEGYKPRVSDRKDRLLPKIEPKVTLVTTRPTGIFTNETELENRYLRHFQTETQEGFYNTLDLTLWNRLVLQACHSEPFVRHSVVAIGALSKALEATFPWGPRYQNAPDPKMAKMHREFALIEYGKALKLMQGILTTSANPRQALIACLLVVCFETFLGDRLLAIAHAETGLRILGQWQKKNFSWSSNKLMSTTSPAPEVVEDEIVEAFANLDMKISTVSDPRSAEVHQMRIDEDEDAVQTMPPIFTDLREARKYWNIIMRRTCHFLATTWSPSKSLSLTRDFVNLPPGTKSIMTGVNIFSTSYEVTDALRSAQRMYAKQISDWMQAFNPLFRAICGKPNPTDYGDYIITSSLRIQYLGASILIAGVLITEETMYDKFFPEFGEMLNLMDVIAESRQHKSNYSFWSGGFLLDLGIVPCLFLTVNRCRDPVMRRHAIKLLNEWQLESFWDPRLISEIGVFMMEVEEEGMVDGVIPETSRAIFSRINQDPEKQLALIQCVLKQGGPRGGKIWREKHVQW